MNSAKIHSAHTTLDEPRAFGAQATISAAAHQPAQEIASAATPSLPRVLHVLEATLGGTLRYLRDILTSVPPGQFAIGLVYSRLRADPGFEDALSQARDKGWKTFEVPMLRAISPAQDLRSASQLRRVIHEFQPDILHCHSSKAGALGRLACLGLRRRPRLVYSPHAIAANLGRQYLLAEKILRPLTDRFGAVSGGERDELVSHGLALHEDVAVISPLIDTGFYSWRSRTEARLQLGIPEDSHLILGIGRLVPQKDPLLFLETIRCLSRNDPKVRAIWLGEGELQQAIAARIIESGLQDIVMLPGWTADVRPYLAAADLLLSTAVYESFGYVAAEALAMEIPVVASAITGTTDILGEDLASLLYPPGDAMAAATIIRGLLADETYARQRGKAGRARVMEEFSPARMHASLTRCYDALLRTVDGSDETTHG